jgi:hypothetical protein
MPWTMRPPDSGLPSQFLNAKDESEAEEILVSVRKLEQEWSGSAHYASLGSDDYKEHKYSRAAKRIQADEDMYMPVLYFQHDEIIGLPDVDRVKFFDGRHTYAAARDAGREVVPVCVPKRQLERFQRQFGT